MFKNNKIIASSLLIAGCCIGAGMLGLPITTGLVGFLPSTIMLFLAWFFMYSTSKLLIEANSWFPKEKINLISLSGKILGKAGQILVWVLFLTLFYTLLAAYFIKGGDILYITYLQKYEYMSPATSILILVIVSFLILNCGVEIINQINLIFMIFLFLSFFMLIEQSIFHMNISNLANVKLDRMIFLFPFLIVSFGYHNLLPSIRNYLDCDDNKLAKSIFIGSVIPLIVYFIWILTMLGIIPLHGLNSITNSFAENKIATEPLGIITGSEMIYSAAMLFSFSAIITSVFGQGLSLIDFIVDGLSMNKKFRFIASIFAILPPYLIISFNPDIFFLALGIGGGIAASILYGFIPALIVYIGRYKFNFKSNYISFKSKISLYLIMLASSLIMLLELARVTGFYKAF